MTKYKYSRRQFMGSLPCLALGTSTLYSSLLNLNSLNKLMVNNSSGGDYKALVCILLSGGNDSYNMLVPRSGTAYADYAAARSNLAINQNDILPINHTTTDGREFGLHPSMTGIQNLFQNGKLAFVNNVGTLVEPVTKEMVESGEGQLPLGLLSHADQVMHWQTAYPQDRVVTGWGGKMADILQSMNSDMGVSMNISLGGNNIFQRGESVTEYAINNDGGVSIFEFGNQEPFFDLMTKDITTSIEKNYEDLFKKSYNDVLKRSIESNEQFNQAITSISPLSTSFSDTDLSQNLRMVANTIAARNDLGAKRQIFFIDFGGFDNHDELLNRHNDLLSILDAAMSEFYQATVELGVDDCVTTYTVSDFARTLSSNGNGTDHAWGGNTMVMGGAVKGKDLYGIYPDLNLGSNLHLDRGIIVPTTSADEYFAELALWFGISPNDLSLVLPNIGNFYDVQSGSAPMGFLL